MMDFEEFKKFLGDGAKEYNDAQLRQLQQEMHHMADLLLEFHLMKKTHRSRRARPSTSDILTD